MSADAKEKTTTKKTTRKKPAVKSGKVSPAKKKPDPKTKQIDQLKNQNKELEDKILRLRAEFDNYRRRKSHEILRLMEYEGEAIFRSFLPIIDDLERMLLTFEEDASGVDDATKRGIGLIITKFSKALEERGVEAFDSIGKILDSEMHDAMLVMQDQEKQDNEIIQEYEKGYMYKDKVLRHAKVVVNKI